MKKVLAVFVFGVFAFIPQAQATWHSEYVNVGSPQWSGECKAISTVSTPQVCGQTYRGVEKGTQDQECQWLPPKGKIECQRGQHRSVSVTRSCNVVAPSCPVTEVKDNDENQEKCEAPSKVLGFRFMFVPDGNRLRWVTKDDVSQVDLRVYDQNKSFLYDYRTKDDGEQFFSNRANFYKIRAVGSCGLSEWSKLIN